MSPKKPTRPQSQPDPHSPQPASPQGRRTPPPNPSQGQSHGQGSPRPPVPPPGSRSDNRPRPVSGASNINGVPRVDRVPRFTPPPPPRRQLNRRPRPTPQSGPPLSGKSAKIRSDSPRLRRGNTSERSVTLRGQAVPPSEPAQPWSSPPPTATVVVEDRPAPPLEPGHRRHPLAWFRWLVSWQFLLLTTIALVSGAGAFSVVSLLRIPNLPNCRAIFWPAASASLRLQCADSYAEQGTVDFYLAAIKLVDRLPEDHPLRGDINGRIEKWARAILDLADDSFNAGELDVAIATARKIPASTAAADLVESRLRQWQRVWNDASEIYEASKQNLAELKFQEAFSLAVQLLDVPNDHWSSTKYNELTRLVGLAREDSGKISKAKQLAKRRTVAAFEEAMELLTSISEDSVIYQTALATQKDMAGDMLKVAESALQRQRLSDAESMLAII
ncbi:MAG: hypothetical protein AAFZ80_04880, partial [Cyanobacteria bacterium P01_A01_bin.105]